MRILLILLLAGKLGSAQTAISPGEVSQPEARAIRVWKFSLAAAGAASVLDAQSSWGKCCESNSLLASSEHTFGTKGALLKAGFMGFQGIAQHSMGRKHPGLRKAFTIANFATAAVFTAVAVRNYQMPRQTPHR